MAFRRVVSPLALALVLVLIAQSFSPATPQNLFGGDPVAGQANTNQQQQQQQQQRQQQQQKQIDGGNILERLGDTLQAALNATASNPVKELNATVTRLLNATGVRGNPLTSLNETFARLGRDNGTASNPLARFNSTVASVLNGTTSDNLEKRLNQTLARVRNVTEEARGALRDTTFKVSYNNGGPAGGILPKVQAPPSVAVSGSPAGCRVHSAWAHAAAIGLALVASGVIPLL